jgi:hypothetical protein
MSHIVANDVIAFASRKEPDATPVSEAERAVLEALRGLAYGHVEVVVHSSRIVQITRSQKVRLDTTP